MSSSFTPGDPSTGGQNRATVRKADLDRANQQAENAQKLLNEFRSLNRALGIINEAIATRPKIARWYVTRAQIYRALGRNQLALYDYNAAIRLEPRLTLNLVSRAICLRKLRRYGDAMADLTAALEADPANPAYHYYRGTVLYHMEDYRGALEEFQTALSGGDKYTAKCKMKRAACYEKLGRVADALADYRQLTRADAGNAGAWTALGLLLTELGRHEEALVAFQGAVDSSSAGTHANYTKYLDNLAWCKALTGRFKEALEDVKTAVDACEAEGGKDPSPLLHRGAVQLALGQPLKALPDLLRAAELTEALVRKEARKDARDGLEAARADASTELGSARGSATVRTATTARRRGREDGGTAPIAAELAAALGEAPPMGPLGVPAPGAGAEDVDTDSDAYSDAERERDHAMQEPPSRKSAADPGSPSKAGGGGGTPSGGAAPPTPSRRRGDDASDTESVGSSSTGGGAGKSMKRAPAARNVLKGAPKGRAAAASGATKPWAMVPPWAKERVWPETIAPFTQPRSKPLCILAARVQAFLAAAYQSLGLGHAARGLQHAQQALAVWPGCVPAIYYGALCRHALGKHAEADAVLTKLLTDTDGIDEEVVRVLPPTFPAELDVESAALAAGKSPTEAALAAIVASIQKSAPSTATLRGQHQHVHGSSRAASSSSASGGAGGAGGSADASPSESPAQAAAQQRSLLLWSPAHAKSAVTVLGITAIELLPPARAESAEAQSAAAAAAAPAAAPADGGSAAPADAAASSGAEDSKTDGITSAASIAAAMTAAAAEAKERQVAATARTRAKVLIARGLSRQAAGNHAAALADFDAAIRYMPQWGASYYHRAVTQYALKKPLAAIADCKLALGAGHDNAALHDLLGQAHAYVGQYQVAITEFTAAYKLSPEWGEVLSRRAQCYRSIGNASLAILDLTNALLLPGFKNDPDFLMQRGVAQYDNDDYDTAISDFRSALAAPPKTPLMTAQLHYNIGVAQANSDVYEEAVSCFTAALGVLEPLCGPRKYLRVPSASGSAFTRMTSGDGSPTPDAPRSPSPGIQRKGDLGMSSKLAAVLASATTAKRGGGAGALTDAPLSAAVGNSLRNMAVHGKGTKNTVVKGVLSRWAQDARVSTAGLKGISSADIAAAQEAEKKASEDGDGPAEARDRITDPAKLSARQKYLLRLADANRGAPLDMVRLRIATTHERAKALQMVGRHQEAIADFSEVLSSCPTLASALFRRAFSYKHLCNFPAAAADFEAARALNPTDPRYDVNYVGLSDVGVIMLHAAGEEPPAPVLGVEPAAAAHFKLEQFVHPPGGGAPTMQV